MRNLWIFLNKYDAFFFFIIFLTISLTLVLKNNSYQRSSFINSSSFITGEAYNRVNSFNSYLDLKATNDALIAENAALRNQLKSAYRYDTSGTGTRTDTLRHQQYTYMSARVINNSVNQKDNFITIDRGFRQGVHKGMGVITNNGVIGIVKDASPNFATIASLLNNETHISATVEGSNAFGALVWGAANYDPRFAVLQDIPNHILVTRGQKVITTDASALFPGGHPIGTVLKINKNSGASFWDINVKLYTDFASLKYVYVVRNLMAAEQQHVEKGAVVK